MLNTNKQCIIALIRKNYLSVTRDWNVHRLLIYGGKLLLEFFPHKEM